MPSKRTQDITREHELNPDPITGEPGSHPIGTGAGAASGGAAGAAIGSVGGPIGTAIGAVVGAVAGGYAGKGVAEAIDPTAEDAYWREHHGNQPFASEERVYEDYAPAYRTGYSGYRPGQTFEARERELQADYERDRSESEDPASVPRSMQNNMSTYPLRWEEARAASRAAYERVQRNAERGK